MERNRFFFAVVVIAILLIAQAIAVPVTNAATKIGNNNFTMNGQGVVDAEGWFQWGMADGQTWARTPNVTANAGIIVYTMKGTPVFGNTNYYYKACDTSGCGAQQSLITLVVTPLPTITYGQWAQNMTESHFDPAVVFWNAMQPYMSITGPTIFYGIIFMMVFVGLWLRTRGTAVAQQLGMIYMGLFASTAVGLQLGLPPEFLAIGQALLYVSLAGAITSWTFK